MEYLPPDQVTVGAYYYPWWKHHFEVTKEGYLRRDLWPRQEIRLGEYDDTKPEVISQHLEWSRQANIALWVASWWGPNSKEDRTLRNVILTHENLGSHKIAILYETTGRIKKTEGYDTFRVAGDFDYICNQEKYFSHPNYYHIHDRPVIVIYLTRLMQREGKLNEVIATVRNVCGDDVYILGDHVWGAAPKSSPGLPLLDGVTNYDVYGNAGKKRYSGQTAIDNFYQDYSDWKDLANASGVGFVPAVSPGYNDRGVRLAKDNPAMSRRLTVDSEEGTLFEAQLQKALQLLDPTADHLVLVNSFNEWHEDTQIEPCDGNATNLPTGYTQGLEYVGYGELYLDLLRNYTSAEPASPTSSPRPSRNPSADPSPRPSRHPSTSPSAEPSKVPTARPTSSARPSRKPSVGPSPRPSYNPSISPSAEPSKVPTANPSSIPTGNLCNDDPEWRTEDKKRMSCEKLRHRIYNEGKKLNKECKRKGTNGLRAFEACPITCRECPPGPRFPTKSPSVDPSSSPSDSPTNAYCLDSDTWSSKQGRTCVDIADRVAETGKDPKKVCKKHKDLDGVTAVQACPATCDYQNCSLRRRQ